MPTRFTRGCCDEQHECCDTSYCMDNNLAGLCTDSSRWPKKIDLTLNYGYPVGEFGSYPTIHPSLACMEDCPDGNETATLMHELWCNARSPCDYVHVIQNDAGEDGCIVSVLSFEGLITTEETWAANSGCGYPTNAWDAPSTGQHLAGWSHHIVYGTKSDDLSESIESACTDAEENDLLTLPYNITLGSEVLSYGRAGFPVPSPPTCSCQDENGDGVAEHWPWQWPTRVSYGVGSPFVRTTGIQDEMIYGVNAGMISYIVDWSECPDYGTRLISAHADGLGHLESTDFLESLECGIL
jgi:hypothetical protein